ncbi:hypothetical protein ABEB36_003490 [Hypothenemus hampei]|uniref:Uncharacterized protein n=1 Tax=Hypothenemus hampei TaxID=57062 RepID=A0ABD1F9C1_HYPHA
MTVIRGRQQNLTPADTEDTLYEGACATCTSLDGDTWVARTMQVRDYIDSENLA